MSLDTARVIWSEGLFLRPQHFQQQERYVEGLIAARLGATAGAASFGFHQLSIDSALLLQGKLALAKARGVLPDGTPFEIPSESARLRPFDVPHDTRDATVYLSAVLQRSGAKMVGLEPSDRATRYESVDAKVADNVLGSDAEAEVKVGVLSLSLGLKAALDGALTSMPVARVIERRADGTVSLDEKFIPPLLDVAAHPRTKGWVEEVHGWVRQRGDELAARIGAPGTKGVAEFSDFVLLLACNRYEPLLAHLKHLAPLHPLALYAELLKLAGECATFGQEASRRPPPFPSYAHAGLGETFEPVIEEIRRTMVSVLDQRTVQIALRDLGKGYFGAEINDVGLVRSAHFVLSASAHMPRESLRASLPTQIKIGSPGNIKDLVRTQVPGVRVEPVDAPRQIPFHANFCYFQLDGRSELWPSIESTRRMVIHVAGDPPALELQMWAIRA